MKLLYTPKLRNGQTVSLRWPIKLFRFFNYVSWPMEDNASATAMRLNRLLQFLSLCIFLQHADAEARYLVQNFHNLNNFLTGMPTFLELLEFIWRLNHLGLFKESFKRLMQTFYSDIYIEE